MVIDAVGREFAEVANSTVTGQARRGHTKLSDRNVVGVLIGQSGRPEKNPGPGDANVAGERERVQRRGLDPRVAAHFEKFNRRAQEVGGFSRFRFALLRRAIAGSFTSRADADKNFASPRDLRQKQAATTEFDVIRMRSNRQNSQRRTERSCHLRGLIWHFHDR